MSFEVNDYTASSAELETAILLYRQGPQGSAICYATIHPVERGDGTAPPVIRAGRPADRASLKAAFASLVSATRIRSGVLTDSILSIGLEHIIWWQRPGQRTYFFDCARPSQEGVASIGTRAGIGFTPGIVFVAKRQTMWGFAVKGDARPEAHTLLYHLPLMNVWETGQICTGSMPLPQETVTESVQAWEKSFWDSSFTHPNHPRPLNYKGGIHQFSIDLLDGRFRKFPQRVLRPIKGQLTVGQLADYFDSLKD